MTTENPLQSQKIICKNILHKYVRFEIKKEKKAKRKKNLELASDTKFFRNSQIKLAPTNSRGNKVLAR